MENKFVRFLTPPLGDPYPLSLIPYPLSLIPYPLSLIPYPLSLIPYPLSNWKALTVYMQEGRLEIDNNRSEQCIKGVVLGRKSYMFMESPHRGHAAAAIYSLEETCKQNNVPPPCLLGGCSSSSPHTP